jgi:cobalt-zinc-cadmium efflux system outer membrane protein
VQPAAAPTLTVDEAVTLAIRQNPRLTAAARDVAAARAGVRSARALTNPTLLFTPAIVRGGSDEEILLQQPLELSGTRSARTGVARAQLRQAQADAVVQLRTLVFDTRSAYYELARAQELLSVAGEVLQTTEEFDRITRRLAEEGLRPGIDRIQTGIEVTRARQQVTLADARVRTAAAALNTLLGRPPTEPVAAASPLSFTPEAVDAAALTQQALTVRAEITLEVAQREKLRQQARLGRAEGRPDLVPQLRTESITRGPREPGIGVAISLPFLDYGSRRNRVRQAEEAARAQEARISAMQNQVRQEVERALARLLAAEAVIRDYQQGVLEQSRRLLEASRTGFQAGQYSVIQVLEAQRTFRQVQSDYLNAQADYALARAELERATGTVPADLLPQPAAPAQPGTERPTTPNRSTR